MQKLKRNYTVPKSYRIITLLNCLGKISEKILATRLAYFAPEMLDADQMGGRKQRSATDAVLALVHNIEMAKTRKNTVSYLLLDVKGAFDHVLIHQLI